MKKIVEKLMDYGMDFQYECRGSHGETIESFELGITVYNQNGKLTLVHGGESDVSPVSDTAFSYVAQRIEDICIEETT